VGRAAIKTINAAHKLPSINKTKFLFINQKTYFVCLSFLFAKLAINKAMRHKKTFIIVALFFHETFLQKKTTKFALFS